MFIFFIVQTSQKTSVNTMSTNSGTVKGKEMTNRDEETADVSATAKQRTVTERGGLSKPEMRMMAGLQRRLLDEFDTRLQQQRISAVKRRLE